MCQSGPDLFLKALYAIRLPTLVSSLVPVWAGPIIPICGALVRFY